MAALAMASALSGCAGWDPEVRARERATETLSCREVQSTKVGEYLYDVEGCGRRVRILCSSGAMDPVCVAVRSPGHEGIEAAHTAGGEEEMPDTRTALVVPPAEPTSDPATSDAELGPALAVAAPPAGDSGPALEADVRAAIDARGAVVLACLDVPLATVVVSCTPTGHTVELRAREGQTVDPSDAGCVSHALRELPRCEGRIVHVIEAR